MKKILSLISSFTLIFSLSVPIYAMDVTPQNTHYSSENISDNLEELDPYISVKNNLFVLDLPSNITLSKELENKLIEILGSTNKFIQNNDYVIGIDKVARPKNEIITRAYGKNAFYLHWNYFEIWMDAGLTKNLAIAGTAGVLGALAAAIPPFAAWMAANPVISAGLYAFATSLIPNLVGDMATNGIIVHYNWIMQKITYIGLQ